MKHIVPIILCVVILVGCGTEQPAPVPTPAPTPVVIPLPSQAPVETTPEMQLFPTVPESPVEWIANCEEYISLRKAKGSDIVLAKIPAGESMNVREWSGKYARVEWCGLEGWVLSSYIKPTDEAYFSARLDIVQPTDIYTHEQMKSDLEQLSELYDAELDIIGKSEQGRDIHVLRIGSVSADTHILFQAAIHGREHMTAWLLTALTEYWLKFGLCSENACLHIIPMTNPDGVEISQRGSLDDAQMQIYQSDISLGFTEDIPEDYAALWKANALGVDINRNFPSGWELIDDHLQPSSERYRGTEPFSCAEAKALRDYTLEYDFDVTVSYHAMGSVVYWEYGDSQPVNELSHSLALAVEAATRYDPEGSESLEGAGYKDWAMDELGIPSLTIEVGCEDAPLHYRELYAIFERNVGVLGAILAWLDK